jgi:hypothetical protein
MKPWATITLSVIGLFLLIFLANEFEIFGVKFWGVRKENARREVFEQTQRQELVKYHHEWVNASDEDKKAIESTIRQSFANFDKDKITDPDLNKFLKEIMLK